MSDQSQFKQSFGVGAVLSSSFSKFFANFIPLLAVILLPSLILSVFSTLMTQNLASAYSNLPIEQLGNPLAMFDLYTNLYWAFLVFSMIVSTIIWGAGILVVHGRITGREITIATCFLRPLQRIIPIIVLSIAITLLMVVAIVPGAILMGLFGSVIGSVIGIVIAFVTAIYLIACFFPFMPAILIEDTKWRALGRTIGLTRGYRWPIVGVLAILFVVIILASILIGIVFGALGMAFFWADTSASVGTLFWVTNILNGLLSTLATGYFCTLTVVIYLKLIEIKEGHSGQDLEKVFQ